MKGKIRVLIDENTKYSALAETLVDKISQLNKEILQDENFIRNLQTDLQATYKALEEHLKARSQMLETLDRMKTIKKIKHIDGEVLNPSEKLSLENPEVEVCWKEDDWKAKEERDKKEGKEMPNKNGKQDFRSKVDWS
jgi:hypothetical protein